MGIANCATPYARGIGATILVPRRRLLFGKVEDDTHDGEMEGRIYFHGYINPKLT